jgi:uncharacterized membrane protein YkoI
MLALGLFAVCGAEAQAQGFRGTLARCAQAAGPMEIRKIERVEMMTAVTPADFPGAPAGTPLLQFEVQNPDGSLWEVTCNGETGAVVDLERQVPSARDPLFQRNAKVGEQEARKAALAARPGKIVGVEYEVGGDGTPEYEFAVQPSGDQARLDVEVDAATGKVVKVRQAGYAVLKE